MDAWHRARGATEAEALTTPLSKGKELFVDEFEQTLEVLSSTPEVGQIYRDARGKLIQRVLMKKTRCHVYYFHDREHALVEVHSVWGAARERGPAL